LPFINLKKGGIMKKIYLVIFVFVTTVLAGVLYADSSEKTVRFWYEGKPGHSAIPGGAIGYATSSDGIYIERYTGNPVIPQGVPGTFNEFESYAPYVGFDGNVYHMLFLGVKLEGGKKTHNIAYATSADGVEWDMYENNPVQLDSGLIDNLGPILYVGGYYKMWYYKDGDIYYASSVNPQDSILDLKKHSDEPIITKGTPGQWDDHSVIPGSVLYENGVYKMWFTGIKISPFSYKIGYAVSTDGITWTKYSGNPVYDDTNRRFEMQPAVIHHSENYKMYYTAATGGSDYYPIRLATSDDGIHWTKYSDTPVLPGGSAYWEKMRLGIRTVMYKIDAPIDAIIDIDPNTLNLKSRGKWVTAYIELPAGHDVVDINIESIKLGGTIPTNPEKNEIGDYDNDGMLDLMVKFDRAAVIDYIKYILGITKGKATLEVTGEITGNSFRGSDTIRVK
jgi:predicted GH43/DUF377 family glycosyl hydrolase